MMHLKIFVGKCSSERVGGRQHRELTMFELHDEAQESLDVHPSVIERSICELNKTDDGYSIMAFVGRERARILGNTGQLWVQLVHNR